MICTMIVIAGLLEGIPIRSLFIPEHRLDALRMIDDKSHPIASHMKKPSSIHMSIPTTIINPSCHFMSHGPSYEGPLLLRGQCILLEYNPPHYES